VSHLAAVRGACARYAETKRDIYATLPRIQYTYLGADFAKESERASLILVDQLRGIVASQTIPRYCLPKNLEGAPVVEWYERISKHPRAIILQKPIETLVPEVLAAEAQGKDLARLARQLRAQVLGEHPQKAETHPGDQRP
jgi:hypothetical protein